jgi:hypothetical protein
MLKLPIIELFLRLLPEGFLFIFAGYAFSRTCIDRNKYILSSVLLGTIGYLIRLLPIDYGIHSILTLVLYITLITNVNKIDIIKAIKASLVTVIFQFVLEGLNVVVIQYLFKKDINTVFQNPILKSVYGIPSLIVMTCVTAFYYFRIHKRKELGNASSRNVS